MYCKSCGYENEDDATICENCGADLNSFSSGRVSKRNKILLIVVALIILVIGIWAIFTLENYIHPDKSPDPRASNLVCPYCGAGPDTLVAVRENSSHIKWYCQYCEYTWWEPIPPEQLLE
ncbi:MAG TPA: zinc ribbon domain-containing protein [Methanobacterium sp.]|nr:zinc ribbon domain-containing protein [Methanobacterium sp.]